MVIPKELTPIPVVSGLALQFGASDPWTAYVGLFAIIAVVVVVALEKVGLLRKVGGNDPGKLRSVDLARSLDALTAEVKQLEATITSQVRIMGTFTEEIRRATQQAAATHNWIKVQKELETERRLRRGEPG